MVQFTVDTLGRAELASFRVLRASHDGFGTAVRAALPRMRFLPAETGGRKVRMVVQQTFDFALQR
jgi:protein TonB